MSAISLRSAVFFLALAGVAAAQTNYGTITGTVQDPGTAVVPNAAVIATNVETGAVYQTLATATGNFTVPSLPAGNYSVSVEAPGFRKYIATERACPGGSSRAPGCDAGGRRDD